jgi:hypothetical protein
MALIRLETKGEIEMRNAKLLFGVSLIVALGLGGCAGADDAPSDDSKTLTAARYEIRSGAVNVLDGSGSLLLGEVTGRVENQSGWARLAVGASSLSTKFSVRLDQDEWIVEGTAEGRSFSARVSQDGRVIERTTQVAFGEDVGALMNAVNATPPRVLTPGYQAQDLFSRDNCQAAGYALVTGGAATADPILLVIGFAFLAGCS